MIAQAMELQIVSFQNLGQRDYQEDAYYVSDDSRLFVVCDGVGGSVKGACASNAVIETVADNYSKFAGRGSKWSPEKALRAAEHVLLTKAGQDPTLAGMSTTVALVYLESASHCVVVHVGDSRVYAYDQVGRQTWCTKDHSIVQELFDQGILDSKEAMQKHPLKNRITKALTAYEDGGHPVEFTTERLEYSVGGGYFLLCSDGVIEQHSDASLQEYIAAQPFLDGIKQLDQSCQRSSKDNNTCIAFKYW